MVASLFMSAVVMLLKFRFLQVWAWIPEPDPMSRIFRDFGLFFRKLVSDFCSRYESSDGW